MIDGTKIGNLAAEVMEIAENTDSPTGGEVTIGTVAIVVEMDVTGVDGHPGYTNVVYRCSDSRRWVQAGFFAAAGRAVFDQDYEEIEPDDAD